MSNKYIISEGGTRGIPIEVEKPNYPPDDLLHSATIDQFNEEMQAYNAALEEAKKNAVPIVGAHPFKDGDAMVEGVDCELTTTHEQTQYKNGEYAREYSEVEILVPLQPTSKEEGEAHLPIPEPLDYYEGFKNGYKLGCSHAPQPTQEQSKAETQRQAAKRYFDTYCGYKDSALAWHVWKRAFDFGVNHAKEVGSREEEAADDKNWYSIKELMIASMEKGSSPEQWVNLSKALGYSITRKTTPTEPENK